MDSPRKDRQFFEENMSIGGRKMMFPFLHDCFLFCNKGWPEGWTCLSLV